MTQTIRNLLAIFLFALGCVSCSDESNTTASDGLVSLSLGPTSIQLELAISRDAQQTGLMYRNSLPENQGMLFIFPAPQRMSFWMRNTRIPLDIGYFTSDGILREKHALYPHDDRSVKSKRSDLIYALETNQGWYKKNGVKIGDKLEIESLQKYLQK